MTEMNDEYDGLKNNKFCPVCHGNVKVYSNTKDFLDWLSDISCCSKKLTNTKYTVKRLKELSEIFVAYCTHINTSTDNIDTPEYRKKWFDYMKYVILTNSFDRAGF